MKGTDSSPKGASVMHSDENWKQFSSQWSANDHLEQAGTVYYAPHLKIQSKLRFSKAGNLDWMGGFPVNLVNLSMLQEYLLAVPWVSLSVRNRPCSYWLAGQQLGRLTAFMENLRLRLAWVTVGFWLLRAPSAGAPVARWAAGGSPGRSPFAQAFCL